MTSQRLAGRTSRASGPPACSPAQAGPIARALRRAAAALAFAACALLALPHGHAANLRVLIAGPSGDDATVARVRQELALLGLDVEVVVAVPGADLAALALEHGAAAAARVEGAPPAIVLWVDEAHSGGLPQESRITSGGDPGLLPLRAIEALRGRLLTEAPERAPAPAPPASGVSPPTPGPSTGPGRSATSGPSASPARPEAGAPPAAPPPARLRLHLGPALAVSPGGVPAAASLRAGAAWRLVAPIELAGLVVVPLSAGSVAAEEGQIDLRVLVLGAGAAARWSDALPRLDLHAGAGAGVAGFLFEGRAVPPWVSASGASWSAMPYIDVGAGYRITELFAVRVDAVASLAFPPPVLVVAGREAASFGAPGVFLSLAAELRP